MTNTQTAIDVVGLSRTYDTGKKTYEAVKNLSFQVHSGEVFGLLGTNGAGKTSTLEVAEGLASPSTGEVRIHDLDPIADRAALRPELGIMLQSGGLPSQLTVQETMQMWHGTCTHPRRICDVLSDVDLTHRVDVRVGALSGGEQRRLDLACALLGDPSILFLDEPTTGLDPESRRKTWELLLALKNRGVTMLLTTHYLEEAEFLADRLAIMNSGEIVLEGTLSELVSQVRSEISFSVGTQPMPKLPVLSGATVSHENSRVVITTAQLQMHTLELLQWSAANSIDLPDFAAHPATLESVFMKVAGAAATSF
ncbi:ABC transporter ATP-binding protein [Corynebacterium alimapuense]|uniref:ABC transporter ATP-binding protein n=1 Tax=Corynebacterium alimapuense TaxID=1576874 RepID=A0A3M8K753_9CORY|nr:ABC transporter ATP-binding protein [Corynebacterium alimapuense]RNE48595.1 ABC transporter ATP-binding protein [Corynebacterium alimapuense]